MTETGPNDRGCPVCKLCVKLVEELKFRSAGPAFLRCSVFTCVQETLHRASHQSVADCADTGAVFICVAADISNKNITPSLLFSHAQYRAQNETLPYLLKTPKVPQAADPRGIITKHKAPTSRSWFSSFLGLYKHLMDS